MNLIALFVIGSLITLLFAAATVIIVLSESSDPESAKDSSLNKLERMLIGKKRERIRSEQEFHDKKKSGNTPRVE